MIYLLRHGETVWNRLGRFQGQLDSQLTNRGIEQADIVARLLHATVSRDLGSFEMQVSPLGRARETAQRVHHVLPIVIREVDLLKEVTVGSWDGMTRFEIDNEFPGILDGTDAFNWYFRSPDGESFDAACSRASSWIASVKRPTVAISHGLFGRIIRGVYAGMSRKDMLELPVPQNAFHCLKNGEISFISGEADLHSSGIALSTPG
ncbi:phosphoglycerate mutase [Rhizobium sp. L9]|uniref:histidine phosphatase family protein n=1 Tax=Rhizobium sp. L9 TaxID=1340738 RepID=UPI000BE9638D|nr:histidine phosphatase family protein [Rhizobium sp. L9]PDT30778.1 phosphoglycerate mutase [Rhizobium sp. L9]